MYVDDYVISFWSVKEAEVVPKDTVTINAAAGSKLRNFVSNNKALQAKLIGDHNFSNNVICVDMERKSAVVKVLGVYWNTRFDYFEFR